MSASADEALQLRDGGKLAYWGDGGRNGTPVFFFHGWPGSCLEFANDQAASEAGAGVCLSTDPAWALGNETRAAELPVPDRPREQTA